MKQIVKDVKAEQSNETLDQIVSYFQIVHQIHCNVEESNEVVWIDTSIEDDSNTTIKHIYYR